MNTLSDAQTSALTEFADNLQLALTGLLTERKEGWTEHELITVLVEEPYGFFEKDCLRDSLSLFRVHFLLFHCLYRLRDEFHRTGQGSLTISALKIQLQSYANTPPGLAVPDPLRLFYLDWSHFSYGQEEVDNLLKGFWQRIAGTASPDQKINALDVLGLKEPTDYKTIKQQYRRLAMKHHPDRGGDPERLKSINGAMFILSRYYK